MDYYRQLPCYWHQDDHDTLVNDCCPGRGLGKMNPLTVADGQHIYHEQIPILNPTYRHFSCGRALEVRLTEDRAIFNVTGSGVKAKTGFHFCLGNFNGSGFGVIDERLSVAEMPQEVAAGIRQALQLTEQLVVAPDCGFNHCPRHIAYRQIPAMTTGAASKSEELA